ncbi:hypothetical protein LTR28_005937, partial [Elasticomyces elasticus]
MSAVNRGRAGKYGKPKRGGKCYGWDFSGKHFSRNLRPLDADGVEQSMWADPKDKAADSSEEEEDSSDEGSSSSAEQETMTREQRRAATKARKEAAIAKAKDKAAQPGDLPPSSSSEEDDTEEDDDDMPANPNHTAKAQKQASKIAVAPDPDAAPKRPAKKPAAAADMSKLSRREREALQAQ